MSLADIDWVERAKAEGVEGFLHPAELAMLMELATGKNVLEVGAYRGLSAWGMAHTAKSVLSIDTFRARTNGQDQMSELTTLDAYKSAVARFANVLPPVVASSARAAETVPGPFDFIFIDAMHRYGDVRDDIQRWWPKLKPGGVMGFHDFLHADFPGVSQAVNEIFGPAPEGTTVVTLRWVTKPL
jgi:predicted O-methyltransferase YrrM